MIENYPALFWSLFNLSPSSFTKEKKIICEKVPQVIIILPQPAPHPRFNPNDQNSCRLQKEDSSLLTAAQFTSCLLQQTIPHSVSLAHQASAATAGTVDSVRLNGLPALVVSEPASSKADSRACQTTCLITGCIISFQDKHVDKSK
ncbi:hypothetical protein CDAR_17661 [Caerostris darwini]|uniref:Uncharacterized protein n=1 Tax=Caerostris darwini TaxID=1538125 RepID=A0AAV4QTW5_9ARAC|nr:hypothetical protein CDAR_17661 [Caerostris darwini]